LDSEALLFFAGKISQVSQVKFDLGKRRFPKSKKLAAQACHAAGKVELRRSHCKKFLQIRVEFFILLAKKSILGSATERL